MSLPNGKARLALLGTVGGAAVIISSAVSWYAGWQSSVEAAVIQQRLVNSHDETLKALVPRVEDCHDVNEAQKYHLAEHDRALTRLENTVERTNDLVQRYLQSQMRRGELQR